VIIASYYIADKSIFKFHADRYFGGQIGSGICSVSGRRSPNTAQEANKLSLEGVAIQSTLSYSFAALPQPLTLNFYFKTNIEFLYTEFTSCRYGRYLSSQSLTGELLVSGLLTD